MPVRVASGRPATPMWPTALALLAVLAGVLWGGAPAAAQAMPDETALAEAYAPIVRLVDQPQACGDGEPYQPTDIALLMGNDEIALRGPWDDVNVVAVAPGAQRLARGLPGYHLDFPGETLRPGCVFEEWSKRLAGQAPPTTYARVVTEAAYPDRLALQYWFFYVFNHWNNLHEGDWEMIQIVFEASTPEQALERGPLEVGYSQHSSAERAAWGDPKMEIVGGTHPVVYPAAGSHANFFSDDLYLMRSSAEGVGCDDTRGPSREIRPAVATVPTRPADYLPIYGWLGFEGRWGERGSGPFNGPTGPNDKAQWTRPITWSQEAWRDRSFSVPGGGAVGTSATDFFCEALTTGSEWLRQAKASPQITIAIVGGLAVLLLWGFSRTAWGPPAPLPLARRRSWGALITSAGRMWREHPRTFLGIGLLFLPLGLVITLLQWLVFRVSTLDALVDEAGESNAFVVALAFGLGLVFTVLGYAIVQAAVAWAAERIDAGGSPTALDAYRAVAGRLRGIVLAIVVLALAQVVLNSTLVLVPVAVYLVVRWSLLGVVAGAEERPSPGILRRSGRLVAGHWWRTASIVLVAAAALLAGPVVGTLILLVTGAAFDLVNLIAAIVYVTTLPFAALVTTYLYHDLRAHPGPAPAGDERAEGTVAAA